MKKLFIILLAAAPLALAAQTKNIAQIYDAYSGKKGVSTVLIPKAMMSMAAAFDAGGSLPSTIDNLRIISVDEIAKADRAMVVALRADIDRLVKSPGYDMIMEAVDGDETVRIYACKGKTEGMLRNLVITVVEPDELAYVIVEGELSSNDVAKVAKMAD